jgi:hypothetical protein
MRWSPYLQSLVARLELTARARIPDRERVRGREQGEGYGGKQGEEIQGSRNIVGGGRRGGTETKEKEGKNYVCLFLLSSQE